VRVELKQLDDLISTANELYRQTTSALVTSGHPAGSDSMQAGLRNLRGRFAEFEERLIKLRLVPVREVFERAAARAGRIAARQLGREVEFIIAGGEVGIEKSMADLISDPILHLVRNAIIHGLEDSESRQAAGKRPIGRITLAASNHSGRIHITVTDDGRGIDLDRVIKVAAEQGIARERLSLDQCLRLIFRPGFSTSPELSEMAGRGIGLDVVDRAMDFAGGEARVATRPGEGTTFALIVPAAFSLVKCVIVRCGQQFYAIDASCVTDLNELGSNGSGTVNIEDLPLYDLRTLFGEVDEDSTATAQLVWQAPQFLRIRPGTEQRYRVAFDALVARQETLVRGLGRYARQWQGVCGAAELYDGNIALMLDLEELIQNG
jgi:two-component system chemotaxis sensor kinase CheA